jgi:hypothetical protein
MFEPEAKINIPQDWTLGAKQRAAVQQLCEYKTDIRGHSDGDSRSMRILIPMKLQPEEYVEIGYLIAQLARDDFPEHYSRFGFTTDCWQGVTNPTVRFDDVVPPGYYRVWIKL